jgi:hypothetical protein
MLVMRQNTLPDYHFLLIAPNLGAEWLFDAARNYWNRFRPTVISDLSLVQLIPGNYTVAVTAIAQKDTAPQIGVDLAQVRSDALFDAVVYDLFDDAKQALNDRAANNEPFGQPLATTPGPTQPFIPTPMVPVRPPGGFITQTPTPSESPTQEGALPPTDTPTPTATPTLEQATPVQPINPTPGPITGG